jgi:tripeptide aminopeptidase
MKHLVKNAFRQSHWHQLPHLARWVVEEAIRVQQIPAPTFFEDERAKYVSQQFLALGLTEVSIDSEKNVYGLLKGLNRAVPALMLMAHTDTVFPADTNLAIRREPHVIFGAGLGDNSIGVSGMLAVAKWFKDQRLAPACDIWFVATSCEEGLGDLKGVRAAYALLQNKIGMVINLEGLAFGHVYHAGIAVHRLHITAETEGGHSWLHFGRPSAIHGIMELGAQITRIVPPTSPRTTYNIGMIEGGTAINAISTKAGLWLDLRSEDLVALERIREQVYQLIRATERNGLSFHVEVVGSRPSGSISTQHPLVQGAMTALELLGVRGTLENGSTDGNIPLQAGCPTVTIGITRGGNAHRLDEYIETEPVEWGMKQLISLVLATTNFQREEHGKMAGD